MSKSILIPAADMKETFRSVLLNEGLSGEKAATLAEVFTTNSVDGVYTHGVNRFPVFVQTMRKGYVRPDAAPTLKSAFNGIERWDGNLGPGPLNAIIATNRAMELARQHGLGCVALAHTNHWMRGGYYGWQAARAGMIFIGWSNTTALMPAWGAVDARLGNNPLVMAVPHNKEAIVLDMALSQFSFGALEMAATKGENLRVAGGYDEEGQLTTNPKAILASGRSLPIGYWKGAGLSLLLDVLAAVLSGGLSTHEIAAQGKEHSLSQLFVCIDPAKLGGVQLMAETVSGIVADYHRSQPDGDASKVVYPGERVLRTREENLRNGIPVLQSVWEKVKALQA